jgi:TolA-binding protein
VDIITIAGLLVGGAATVLLTVTFRRLLASNQVVSESVTAFAKLQDTKETPSGHLEGQDSELLPRMEELERRMERMHKDVMRHLQSISKKEQRVNALLEEEPEDGEMSEKTARDLLAQENTSPATNGPTGQLTIGQIEQMGGR